MPLIELTISQIQRGLLNKEFSVLELCQAYLNQIEKKDKDIFAFLEKNEEKIILSAKKIGATIGKTENLSPLFGIPFAVKDNILVKGLKCTAGSKILEDYIAPYNATVIEALENVNALVIGKTNLDEFAMGSSTENSAFGPTKNPYDLTRVPGGSSGGSSAAVAANFCTFALGSDTGGSIRQPSSFCGVVGLKPTWGAVSRYGLIAFASSLDQIGPMARTVKDVKIVFEAIAQKDKKDSTSVYVEPSNLKINIKELRVGIPKEYFIKGIDPEVEKVVKGSIKKYEQMGIKFQEISLPHTEYALPCYYIIAPSEASSNLARYDGIRYGFSKYKKSAIEKQSIFDVYKESRAEGFGEEVKRRIMIGTYALSSGYYDAYYLTAQKITALIKQDFEKAFEQVDVIFSPTCPTTAFKLGEKTKDPLSMYLSDIFTAAVNLAGLPALSLPIGKANNLPVGLQIIGKPFEEETILNVAEFFEQLEEKNN